MDIDKDFADPQIERDGVWIPYRDDSKLLIARLGNSNWQSKHDRLMKPFVRMVRDGKMPTKKQTDLLCESYAGTIVLDWSGFTKSGKALKFTEEACARLLKERLDFRNDVSILASDEENFKRAVDEESAKNSSKSSNGN